MRKKFFAVLVLLLALSPLFASAQDFMIVSKAINNKANLFEAASFELAICPSRR
ncbi:MAG: hypothetical protein NTV63_03795 [Candidatus Woesearchaeota archaeon]|nr:hypothetical protein [Candidatus Woesearchaeota archaeon]